MIKKRFNNCFFLLVFIFSSGLSIPSQADKTPSQAPTLRPFVATYMVTALGLEGINVTNSLSLDKKSQTKNDIGETLYHFKSYSMPVGLLAFKKDETRNEQSEGFIRDARVYPLKYSFIQIRNNITHRNVELDFNWDKKEVINYHKHKNSKWVMKIPDNTVDKLSYQLAMMLFLKKNSSHATHSEQQNNQQKNKEFHLNIADGGRIKDYDFKILGEERIYTSLGSYKTSYQTIKIHHHRYNKDKNITLWCAPELDYLPVKIVQEEPGKPDFVSTLISYQEGMSGK